MSDLRIDSAPALRLVLRGALAFEGAIGAVPGADLVEVPSAPTAASLLHQGDPAGPAAARRSLIGDTAAAGPVARPSAGEVHLVPLGRRPGDRRTRLIQPRAER